MLSTLLVPLDGSEYSERALVLATDLAKLSGARLSLITVVSAYKDAHAATPLTLEAQTQKRAEGYLAPHVETARAAGLTVEGKVAYGAPAEEIVKQAQATAADLIVMSTHGIGGASGLHFLGSVAMKVLGTAPCPVLMVRIPS